MFNWFRKLFPDNPNNPSWQKLVNKASLAQELYGDDALEDFKVAQNKSIREFAKQRMNIDLSDKLLNDPKVRQRWLDRMNASKK